LKDNQSLTDKDVQKIKEAALKYFVQDAATQHNVDNFVAKCYIKATLDFLVSKELITKEVKVK